MCTICEEYWRTVYKDYWQDPTGWPWNLEQEEENCLEKDNGPAFTTPEKRPTAPLSAVLSDDTIPPSSVSEHARRWNACMG